MKKEVTPQDIEKLRKYTVDLHPAFPGDNVAVAVFCSREYLPIAATTLQSVIAHTSLWRNYDLLIVSSEVSDEEENELQALVKGRENCSIRVVDGAPFMELIYQGLRQENFSVNLHESLRLYVSFVCRNYEKVVCLGADVIIQTDVAELYDMELGDHFLVAAKTFYDCPRARRRKAIREMCPQPWEMEDVNSWRMPEHIYYGEKIGCSQEHPGFNGDVLLLNIPLLAEEKFFEDGLNSLFRERWRTLSEAVYMKLLKQKTIMLGMEWNLQPSPDPYDEWGGKLKLDTDEAEAYAELVRQAKIFHFMGIANKKPWVNPAAPLGWLWWKYARETPFYEQLLSITFETHSRETEAYARKMFNEWRKIPSLKRKMRFLRVARQFTFGKTRRRLKEKEWALKTRIREFRAMIR